MCVARCKCREKGAEAGHAFFDDEIVSDKTVTHQWCVPCLFNCRCRHCWILSYLYLYLYPFVKCLYHCLYNLSNTKAYSLIRKIVVAHYISVISNFIDNYPYFQLMDIDGG